MYVINLLKKETFFTTEIYWVMQKIIPVSVSWEFPQGVVANLAALIGELYHLNKACANGLER